MSGCVPSMTTTATGKSLSGGELHAVSLHDSLIVRCGRLTSSLAATAHTSSA